MHHADSTPENLNPRRTMLAGLGGLAAGALLAGGRTAHAGPLNPPAGPIAPTMKRLDEVEARIPINTLPGSSNSVHRVLQPGSYYLTGDIVGEVGKSGIQVISLAGEVVIDLNGFTIRGVDGSFVGISCNGTSPRVVIRNGQIRGWGASGVNASCPMVLEDLRIEECGQQGAKGGDLVASQVRRCVFAGNVGDGLSVGNGSVIEHCSASGNTGNGISVSINCTATNCTASNNAANGMVTGSGCTIINSSAAGNGETGITIGSGTVISNFSAVNNDLGIFAFSGCTISNCAGTSNGAVGITGTIGCMVEKCTASSNGSDGIRFVSSSQIRNNTSYNNGLSGSGAGIRITNSNNRLEGNNCTNNPVGIQCAGSGCFLARNTCSSNVSNWSVAAGNACFIVNATLSGLIVGNSGGVSPGSTDPNANYTY